MSIYLLLFTVTTPIGESCYSLTQRNLNTFCLSPSRHPSESRTCYPPTQHNLYNSKYLYFSPSRHPSESRMCYPLTQHNPYISLQIPLLFNVTTPVGESYMPPTHSTQPLYQSQNTFTFHRHDTRRKVVCATHILNTTSTSQNTFYFSPSMTPPIWESYMSPTHSTQPLHLQISFLFTVTPTVAKSYTCYPHTQHNPYISRDLFLFPVTPPVGEPCHSRAVPMTLHNLQWPRDVLGTSGRGWPFTQLTTR